MRLERELKRVKRESQRFQDEVTRLTKLIEQMKNIEDDELLMIEKIQTKEIYGKAQKMKISDLQKETHKIRIEKDRLKIVNTTNERVIKEKQGEILGLRQEIDRLKRESQTPVYRTEYKESPELIRKIRNLQEDLRILRNQRSVVKTVRPKLNNRKVYVEKGKSSEISKLKQCLLARDGVIKKQNQEIGKMKEEMEILQNSNEIERLNNAYLEMKTKFNLEKDNVIKLGDILGQKDELIKETSSRIHQKNSIIEKFQNDLRNSVSKEDWNSLQNKMEDFIKQNAELSRKIKQFQHENQRLQNLQASFQKNQENLQNDLKLSQIKENETIESMEKLKRELQNKSDELAKMREYIQNMQNLQNKRNMDSSRLQKEMETQIDYFKQMQIDLKGEIERLKLELERLDSVIDEKDEMIRKLENQSNDYDSFRQEEIKFNQKVRKNSPSEYHRGGYQHDPEEEYHSIMTLKSVQPKQGRLSSRKNSFLEENDRLKIEIERMKKNAEVEKQETEYNSNSLKETIRRLEDDLEDLLTENRKLKNKFKDDQGDGEWWKTKFQGLEAQYKELINRFDLFTESSDKNKKFLEKRIREKEREIEKMEERLNDVQNEQNKRLFGILGELKDKNQGNNQNKEMLKEVITKVNELFKRSSSFFYLIESHNK